MMSFKSVTFVGNVGRGPEIRSTNEGTLVINFPLAVDMYMGKDDDGKAKTELMWMTVSVWKHLAETTAKIVKKGSLVLVSGELLIRKYTDKNKVEKTRVEVRADRIKLLDNKTKGGEAKAAKEVEE